MPAVWYKVKAGIEAALAAEPDERKRKLALWAITTGTEMARRKSDQKPIPADAEGAARRSPIASS